MDIYIHIYSVMVKPPRKLRENILWFFSHWPKRPSGGVEGRVVTPPHKLAIGKLRISNYVLRLLVITELWDFKLRDFVDDLLLDRGISNYVITTFQISLMVYYGIT